MLSALWLLFPKSVNDLVLIILKQNPAQPAHLLWRIKINSVNPGLCQKAQYGVQNIKIKPH